MRYRLIIFDWDGTLMDSAPRIVACMALAMEDVGWPVASEEAIRDIIGLGLPEAIARLCPGIEPERAERLRERYSHHFVEAERHQLPLSFFEGVEPALERLAANPAQLLAVATGKSRRGLDRIFTERNCARWFDDSRTADLTRSKPDPLMLEELLDALGVAVSDAVMIGDSTYDLEMAERLGMDRIGVAWGVHARDRLARFSPLFIAEDFDSLAAWLETPPDRKGAPHE